MTLSIILAMIEPWQVAIIVIGLIIYFLIKKQKKNRHDEKYPSVSKPPYRVLGSEQNRFLLNEMQRESFNKMMHTGKWFKYPILEELEKERKEEFESRRQRTWTEQIPEWEVEQQADREARAREDRELQSTYDRNTWC